MTFIEWIAALKAKEEPTWHTAMAYTIGNVLRDRPPPPELQPHDEYTWICAVCGFESDTAERWMLAELEMRWRAEGGRDRG